MRIKWVTCKSLTGSGLYYWTSLLVVIRLAMQGTQVQSLVREIRSHKLQSNQAHAPQPLSFCSGTCAAQQRSRRREHPEQHGQRVAPLAATRESPLTASSTQSSQSLIIIFFKFIKNLSFVFQSHHVACRILVPQPGTQTVRPAVEPQGRNHCTTREVPGQT